jgi:hypothetical protein
MSEWSNLLGSTHHGGPNYPPMQKCTPGVTELRHLEGINQFGVPGLPLVGPRTYLRVLSGSGPKRHASWPLFGLALGVKRNVVVDGSHAPPPPFGLPQPRPMGCIKGFHSSLRATRRGSAVRLRAHEIFMPGTQNSRAIYASTARSGPRRGHRRSSRQRTSMRRARAGSMCRGGLTLQHEARKLANHACKPSSCTPTDEGACGRRVRPNLTD